MSMCVLGMSAELAEQGIAANALWPRTVIWTAAVENLLAPHARPHCRKPEIMADAAYAILTSDSRQCTGNFFIDEDLLRTRRHRFRSIRHRTRPAAPAGLLHRLKTCQRAGAYIQRVSGEGFATLQQRPIIE